jgi:hypothetical protein
MLFAKWAAHVTRCAIVAAFDEPDENEKGK